MSAEDRQFLNKNFKRYGLAWAGGLDSLEEHFDLVPVARAKAIVLELTLKAPPRVSFSINVTRDGGQMSTSGPELPPAPELTETELAKVGQILRQQGELWLAEPPNGVLRIVPLTKGLAAVQGTGKLQTRRFDRRAMLYVTPEERGEEMICLWLDLDSTMEGMTWVDVPIYGNRGRWLPSKEVAFLDKALRENGDFGVYGNVRDGLRALATSMEVKLRETDTSWSVSATPRDGHGHFLRFSVEKETGNIGPVAAGHLID